MKLCCFGWLFLQNEILTFDNLLKRGFQGPNICTQCMAIEESILHLALLCPYALEVWKYVLQFAELQVQVNDYAIDGLLRHWKGMIYVTLLFFLAYCDDRTVRGGIFTDLISP